MEFCCKSSMGIALGKTQKASTAQLSLGLGGSFATGLQEASCDRSQTCCHSHGLLMFVFPSPPLHLE